MGNIGPIKRIIEVLPEEEPIDTPAPTAEPLEVPAEREREPVG